MTRTIAIDVTQKDIDGGTRVSAGDCAIALAAKRIMNAVRLSVAGTVLSDHDHAGYWRLAPEAVEFQKNFDRGQPVKPFTVYASLVVAA